MSWKGPRKVGEPSPPYKGSGKKLTKKGKEIRDRVQSKKVSKYSEYTAVFHDRNWHSTTGKDKGNVTSNLVFIDDFVLDKNTTSRNITDMFFEHYLFQPYDSISKYLRKRTKDLFDLKNVDISNLDVKGKLGLSEKGVKYIDKAIIELYKNTQKGLKKDYPNKNSIKLYRGIDITGKGGKISPRPLNSFTSDREVAKRFASSMLIEMEVPFKNILAYPKNTSIDRYKQREFFVIGNYNKF